MKVFYKQTYENSNYSVDLKYSVNAVEPFGSFVQLHTTTCELQNGQLELTLGYYFFVVGF